MLLWATKSKTITANIDRIWREFAKQSQQDSALQDGWESTPTAKKQPGPNPQSTPPYSTPDLGRETRQQILERRRVQKKIRAFCMPALQMGRTRYIAVALGSVDEAAWSKNKGRLLCQNFETLPLPYLRLRHFSSDTSIHLHTATPQTTNAKFGSAMRSSDQSRWFASQRLWHHCFLEAFFGVEADPAFGIVGGYSHWKRRERKEKNFEDVAICCYKEVLVI